MSPHEQQTVWVLQTVVGQLQLHTDRRLCLLFSGRPGSFVGSATLWQPLIEREKLVRLQVSD